MYLFIWVFQWAISYLQDNSPYDEYLYLITVYTGIKRNAGTSSNVYIHIIDGKLKQCTTRARLLDDGEQKVSDFDTLD